MFAWHPGNTTLDPVTRIPERWAENFSGLISGQGMETITPDDGLEIASIHGGVPPVRCAIMPLGAGFQAGAGVACAGRPGVPIRASDDIAAGVLKVWSGQVLETFRYDPATGRPESPSVPPPIPPASVVPTSTATLDLPQAAAPTVGAGAD